MIKKTDQELIDAAESLLNKAYKKSVHTVAAAVRTTDGKIFCTMNSHHFSSFVCAETAALDNLINSGHYNVDTVVAVKIYSNGKRGVANPCGKCQQIFHDYAPKTKFIVNDSDELFCKTIDELLPFSFKRQQEKIQEMIGGEDE
jgi:cytidine deaminase